MNEGQIDQAAFHLQKLATILERQLGQISIPAEDATLVRRALDAYVDYRVGYILSQTVINGAQLIRVGECPSP